LPEVEFNRSKRGGNDGKGLFAQLKGYLLSTNICGTCGKHVTEFPENRDETPNPWHQAATPNPPYNLCKSNIYCRCGNVYCYECRPCLNWRNEIIPVEQTTQEMRTSRLCLWCKSYPPCVEASLKVCVEI